MSSTPRTWSYGRAFFLTFGLGFLALTTVVWIAQGHEAEEWPAFAWLLFGGIAAIGFVACLAAMRCSNQTIKRWLDSAGTHEGAIVIAIVAAPVYWLGKLFEKPRRKR